MEILNYAEDLIYLCRSFYISIHLIQLIVMDNLTRSLVGIVVDMDLMHLEVIVQSNVSVMVSVQSMSRVIKQQRRLQNVFQWQSLINMIIP